jgi:hypothetical protein
MKQQKPEIIQGDKGLARRWLIVIALYLLLVVWLEPLIDFILMQLPLSPTDEAIAALNQKKRYMSSLAFGVARTLPIMLFLWLGWQIVRSQRLPPKGLRMPMTVHVIKGRKAAMIGMVMVALALLLLLRELTMLASAQPLL